MAFAIALNYSLDPLIYTNKKFEILDENLNYILRHILNIEEILLKMIFFFYAIFYSLLPCDDIAYKSIISKFYMKIGHPENIN